MFLNRNRKKKIRKGKSHARQTHHTTKNSETNKLLSSYEYIIIKKKNDTFAIKRDVITIWLILGYIVLRLYDSITSRIRNFLHKFV